MAAFVRLASPIGFESPDGKPVQLLVFLLVPEQATQMHLEILSELAQMLSNRALRDALLAEPSASAVHSLLTHWEPAQSGATA
ncbi:Nitrogen regulatory protein [Mycobacteroides abscessus subsp. abscessus]|nr:Nitrogen regulatory protein [Mycobacteroides abscessus subsp. abscessus]